MSPDDRNRRRGRMELVHGAAKRVVDSVIAASIVARQVRRAPRSALSLPDMARDGRLAYLGTGKYVLFEDKLFLDCFAPSWPGPAFDRLADHVAYLLAGGDPAASRFVPYLVISITKRCVYRCEHCYAASTLGPRDVVSREVILEAVRQAQAGGLGVIAWEGGEPLLRFDDLLTFVRETHDESEAWLATTGWGLTESRASRLREAGLTAAIVSLDHHDPDKHNAFRRNRRAFDTAVEAVRLFRQAGVLPCICICATRETVRGDSLYRYLELAKSIGAAFVQVLDATPSGSYLGKSVLLTRRELESLKRFHVEANTSPSWADHPAVSVRTLIEDDGHFGCCACNGLCYIDSSGNLQACDLLQISFGNVFEEGFAPVFERMQRHFPDFSRGRCPAQTLHAEIAKAHGAGRPLPLPHEACDAILERIRRRPSISGRPRPDLGQPRW